MPAKIDPIFSLQLKEIPYEKILVKDMTERMHFVRKTFYHYFKNKKACLESLTD